MPRDPGIGRHLKGPDRLTGEDRQVIRTIDKELKKKWRLLLDLTVGVGSDTYRSRKGRKQSSHSRKRFELGGQLLQS